MQQAAMWARSALLDCLRRGVSQALPCLHQPPWLPHNLWQASFRPLTATTSHPSESAAASAPESAAIPQSDQLRSTPAASSTTAQPAEPTPAGGKANTAGASTASTFLETDSSQTDADISSAGYSMAFGTRQIARQSRGREKLQGVVHVYNTMNNIHLALTDLEGNVKVSRTAGSVGFRNARKSQPVATEKAAESLAKDALKLGYSSVVVRMNGVGPHKQLAAQMLHACGLRITELQDVTPVAYNGCRLPKRRRI